MKCESGVKQINYPQETVYAKIADLNNLSLIRDKFNDFGAQSRMKENIPEEKIEQVRKTLDTMQFDTDSVSFNMNPIGQIAIQVVEREAPNNIKFSSVSSPIGFSIVVHLLHTTEETCRIKVTLDANINPFLQAVLEKQLKQGVDKLADMLAIFPYE